MEWENSPAEVEIPLSVFAVLRKQFSLRPPNPSHSLAITLRKSYLVGFANEVKTKSAFAMKEICVFLLREIVGAALSCAHYPGWD